MLYNGGTATISTAEACSVTSQTAFNALTSRIEQTIKTRLCDNAAATLFKDSFNASLLREEYSRCSLNMQFNPIAIFIPQSLCLGSCNDKDPSLATGALPDTNESPPITSLTALPALRWKGFSVDEMKRQLLLRRFLLRYFCSDVV